MIVRQLTFGLGPRHRLLDDPLLLGPAILVALRDLDRERPRPRAAGIVVGEIALQFQRRHRRPESSDGIDPLGQLERDRLLVHGTDREVVAALDQQCPEPRVGGLRQVPQRERREPRFSPTSGMTSAIVPSPASVVASTSSRFAGSGRRSDP